jgi:hypothetical protein
MSIYRKFEKETYSDVHAKPLKQDTTTRPDVTPPPHKGAPAEEPLPQTMTWAAKLPRDIRPMSLIRAYPRIANLMATRWTDPTSFRPYIDELFVDRRGNRQGFPPEVMAELFALRGYYEELHPLMDSRWGNTNKR